jgi:hypothetical protein
MCLTSTLPCKSSLVMLQALLYSAKATMGAGRFSPGPGRSPDGFGNLVPFPKAGTLEVRRHRLN